MRRKYTRPLGRQPYQLLKWMMQQQIETVQIACIGEITSVDPENYLAKVNLQPVGGETGWLPICTLHAGPGYGIAALPPLGAQVLVVFEAGDINLGRIVGFTFNKVDTPPQIQPGQVLISNESNASILLDADGTVKLTGGSKGIARVGDQVQVVVNGTTYTGTIVTGSTTALA